MNKVVNNQRRYVINNTTFKNLLSFILTLRISLTVKLKIYCVLKLKEMQFRKYKRSKNIPQNQGHSKRQNTHLDFSPSLTLSKWKKQNSALHCGVHKINHNALFLDLYATTSSQRFTGANWTNHSSKGVAWFSRLGKHRKA